MANLTVGTTVASDSRWIIRNSRSWWPRRPIPV